MTALFRVLIGRPLMDTSNQAFAWIFSLFLLAPRLYIALPFWNAGQIRLQSWSSQTYLFQCETPVPLLPPAVARGLGIEPLPYLDPLVAAYMTVIGELTLPILVMLGLFGRLSSLGLAVMAAVIFFFVGGPEFVGVDLNCFGESTNVIANFIEQAPWMIMGVMVFFTGPGKISVDALLDSFLKPKQT